MAGDPSKIVGIANALNQNVLQQQQIRAGQGVERLYDGAIRPDGTVDNALLMSRAPTLGVKGPEVVTQLQHQQGQRLQNASAQTLHATTLYGALANLEKPSASDVHNISATIAATMPDVPPAVISNLAKTILRDPDGIKHGAALLQNIAIGPQGLATRNEAPPSEGGAKQSAPLGTLNLQGTLPTGLPPGEQTIMEASAKRYEALRGTAASSPQVHADLSNLLHDSKILGTIAGPTVEMEKRANALAQRIGIKDGITLGADKQAAAESFGKIVNQMSSNQQRQMSDAGLHVSEASNPSLMMSQVGREGVIGMLRGNQDALDRLRIEASKAKIPAAKYDEWVGEFGRNYDVRVFQFNRMDKDQKQKFLDAMSPADAAKFGARYDEYHKKNWLP